MCGIVGFVSPEPSAPETIVEMTHALDHRGPDASATFVDDDGRICLGHTRLRILDLSDAANQPFYSSSKRSVIVFNGEIYNFKNLRTELERTHQVRFRTTSDTEVLVEAFERWGPGMVARLEGMFAAVILDIATHELFMFRDRLGKKPLFYTDDDRFFAFASELKALKKHPLINSRLRPARSAIASFLHLGYVPGPMTIYENVWKFPAASYGVKRPGRKLEITPYWSPVKHFPGGDNPVDGVAHLEVLLENAVEKRMISDVPLGAFLSGGTDSSLVAALASKLSVVPLKTFSIGFEDDHHDETRFSRAVAAQLGTEHTEFVLKEREALEWMDIYLDQFDEPFSDTSSIPTLLVSKLARQHVTVALTGDGGDELFQGYGAYRWAQRMASFVFRTAAPLLRFAFRQSGSSRWMRVADMLDFPPDNIRSHVFSQEQYLFSSREIADRVLLPNGEYPLFRYDDPNEWVNADPAEAQALFDLQFYLKDDLLVKVDRASMYSGLECRCPLLDQHVVEYALKLPLLQKVKGKTSKWVLKHLLSRHISADLVHRPKRGFSVPLARWLNGDMRYMLDSYLDADVLHDAGLVRVETIKELRKRFEAGQHHLYNRLWATIVLHRWWLKNN